jgi:hypothetical protein
VNNYAYAGIVRGAGFDVLAAEDGRPGPYRLTTVGPGDGSAPEDGEIRLSDYDQRGLFVRGIGRDGWIYAASIVEEAGPILTLILSASFGDPRSAPELATLVFSGG